SSGSRAASAAFTRNRTPAKSPLAVPGSKPNCDSLNQSWWLRSAQPRARRSSALRFASHASAARSFPQDLRRKSSLPFIRHRCCDNQTRHRASRSTRISLRTFASSSKRREKIECRSTILVRPTFWVLDSPFSFDRAKLDQRVASKLAVAVAVVKEMVADLGVMFLAVIFCVPDQAVEHAK